MGVLSGDEIKRRANEIFEPDPKPDFDTCLEPAAYNLRLGKNHLIIDGEPFDLNHPFHESYIALPPKQISLLSSMEKLRLAPDICARVGISFEFSRKGLQPLFGPQIDPGYNEFFYAVVYNSRADEIILNEKERVFKVEFHTVDKTVDPSIKRAQSLTFDEIKKELIPLTKENSVGKLKKDNEDFKDRIQSLEKSHAQIREGYNQLFYFGILLISATIFGVMYNSLLNLPKETNDLNVFGNIVQIQIIIGLLIMGFFGVMFTLLCIIFYRTYTFDRKSKPNEQLIFTLSASDKKNLFRGDVKTNIQKVFDNYGMHYTDKLQVAKVDSKNWRIIDGYIEYRIKDERKKACIYRCQ